MVTVIADKEELSTPVNNGVTIDSNDNERPFQYIKDYREVRLMGKNNVFSLSVEQISHVPLFDCRWIFIDQARVNLYPKIWSMVQWRNLQ